MPQETFLAVTKDAGGNLVQSAHTDENDIDHLKDQAIAGEAVLVRANDMTTWQGQEKGSGSWEAPTIN